MWFEFTVPKSPVPLPTLSCSNLHGSLRSCHIPGCCTSVQTLRRSHSRYSCSNVHLEGHCCIALGSALHIVRKNWGYPKCQWSLLNGFAGIPLREILSAHPMLVIFPLCRMKIHELKGKTMAKPEIFLILAGLGQLAKATYSKWHENYTHDNNVQWNIFKLRWNQVCNPSDAAALDNFSFFPLLFLFLAFLLIFFKKNKS